MGMGTRPGRRVGRPRAVTEQAILDAALQQLDQGGAGAVSVRGIAAQIGLAPNAVYTYFPNKTALLHALADRFLGEVNHDRFTDRAVPWRHRVTAMALELRSHLVAHPGAVHLLLSGPLNGPNSLALNETLSEVLADAGAASDHAARATYVLIVYLLGAIALEVADLNDPGVAPTEPDRIATRRATLQALPPGTYPRTTDTADTVSKYLSTDQFRWGLDRILDGLKPQSGSAHSDAPS
jgi:AcrR family transcriptional regulator